MAGRRKASQDAKEEDHRPVTGPDGHRSGTQQPQLLVAARARASSRFASPLPGDQLDEQVGGGGKQCGAKTLVIHPARPRQLLTKNWPGPAGADMVRLSVGIEDVDRHPVGYRPGTGRATA